MHHHTPERETPHRLQALAFQLKTRLFQLRRRILETGRRPTAYGKARALMDAPVVAEKRAPLWRELSPEEFAFCGRPLNEPLGRTGERDKEGVAVLRPPKGLVSSAAV